jgi:hypothetical protein
MKSHTTRTLIWLGLTGTVVLLLLGVAIAAQAAQAPTIRSQAEMDIPVFLPAIFDGRSSLPPAAGDEYIVIGWNDLGMHCYDFDYSVLSVLPPYNTLWAQVIRRGNPPELVTDGVVVEYSFPENTRSDNKTNFWDYEDKLFGVDLAPNVGLAGFGLADEMELKSGYFEAVGIPLTEFTDSHPTTPEYLQLAEIVAKDATTHEVLASSQVVAPVSSEMRCDVCHDEPFQNDFRRSILAKHDEEEHTSLLAQADAGDPVLCADCHADPALGMPGIPEAGSLSAVMHSKHVEEEEAFPSDPYQQNCYACHPGPDTKCLRDVMSTQYDMTCVDCHVGGMQALGSRSRTPWVDEPRCGNCHDAQYAENQDTLYRFSTGHGGLYCESCHNSTHAILTSREQRDNLQVIALQGYAGTLQDCMVCHTVMPTEGGPHE